jgi:DNA-directed RNA polymerase subunit RPC12/RpoP
MTCATCGRPFDARRRDHRYCSAVCRSRGLARRRAERLRAALAGLDVARAALAEELDRWEAAAGAG